MKRFILIAVIITAGALVFAHRVSAISYCGKTSGVETGGINNSSVTITLNATSGGVAVSDGATVTNPTLVVTGTVKSIIGQSVTCVAPGTPNNICYPNGDPSCNSYERARIDTIYVQSPSGLTGCADAVGYCGPKPSPVNLSPQSRTYARSVPLVVGRNDIQVSAQHGYGGAFQKACGWGIACRLGTGLAQAFKTITVYYNPATPTPTPVDAADWQGENTNWYTQLAQPGDQITVTVAMKNCRETGDCTALNTWNGASGYVLDASSNNAGWGFPNAVSATVIPGSLGTFTFYWTAPQGFSGDKILYPFQMAHNGVKFGQATPQVTVHVNARPQGAIKTADCVAGISGYALNPETPASAISWRAFENGSVVYGPLLANGAYDAPYNGHGWGPWVPPRDGVAHSYTIQALDPTDGIWYPIGTADLKCNPAPVVTKVSFVGTPNYCVAGPTGTFSWESTANPQTAFQLVVTDETGAKYDTGKVTGAQTTQSVPVTYKHTYTGTVWVWTDIKSGPSATATLKTPTGAYPNPITLSFDPATPSAGVEETFTDTTAYGGSSPTQRVWDFGDFSTTTENPGTGSITHTYASVSAGLTVTLKVSTNWMNPGDSCIGTLPLTVASGSLNIPTFREVRPGQSTPTP